MSAYTQRAGRADRVIARFATAHAVTYLHSTGLLSNDNAGPSGDWRLTGAVEYGRGYTSGKVVRRYSLDDIVARRVPWFYRNGKQRCFPTDIDHGTHRVWMSPPLVNVDVSVTPSR